MLDDGWMACLSRNDLAELRCPTLVVEQFQEHVLRREGLLGQRDRGLEYPLWIAVFTETVWTKSVGDSSQQRPVGLRVKQRVVVPVGRLAERADSMAGARHEIRHIAEDPRANWIYRSDANAGGAGPSESLAPPPAVASHGASPTAPHRRQHGAQRSPLPLGALGGQRLQVSRECLCPNVMRRNMSENSSRGPFTTERAAPTEPESCGPQRDALERGDRGSSACGNPTGTPTGRPPERQAPLRCRLRRLSRRQRRDHQGRVSTACPRPI